MAQELREGDGKAGIARAGKRKWGYDPAQVDAFLERAHALYDSEGIQLTQRDIQAVSFDLTKDGYVIAQVDAALNRLERAVVDKQTAWEIAQHGRVTWKAQTENLYQQVVAHVEREPGERFKPGEPKQPSYDKKQVDRIVDQIVDKAAASLGVDGVTQDDVRDLADLNANSVSNVIFTQRKGKKGYDERQVDYFLNACIQLLSRIESYTRVGDVPAGEPSSAEPPAPAAAPVAVPAAKTEAVSPLFPSDTPRPASDERFAPQPVVADDAFDALHQAEQSLFSASPEEEKSEHVAAAAAQPVSFAPVQHAVPTPSVPDAPSFEPEPAPSVATEATAASAPVSKQPDDSSLAALAHMAEVSQEGPASDTPSFAPKMPSLDTPSGLKLNDMPSLAAPIPTPAPAAPDVNHAAAPEAPAAQEPVQQKPAAPDVMPVSFAPVNKPARAAGSVPVQVPAPAAEKPADAPTEPPVPEDAPQENHADVQFPSLFPIDNDFNSDIPDLSFPTLDTDDTKKEQ